MKVGNLVFDCCLSVVNNSDPSVLSYQLGNNLDLMVVSGLYQGPICQASKKAGT